MSPAAAYAIRPDVDGTSELATAQVERMRDVADRSIPVFGIAVHCTGSGIVTKALGFVREVIRDGWVTAAHDVSDGGLACALAEMAIAAGLGIAADLDPLVELRGGSGESCLFGEGPGGLVLSVSPDRCEGLLQTAEEAGVKALDLGAVGGDRLSFSAAERDVSVALADAGRTWRSLADRV